jgi:hypothetical protein
MNSYSYLPVEQQDANDSLNEGEGDPFLIPSKDDQDLVYDELKEAHTPISSKRSSSRWTVATVIASILNISFLAWVLKNEKVKGYTHMPYPTTLPNQFPSLESIVPQGAAWLSNHIIHAFPSLLQQISYDEPSKVFPDDPRRYRTEDFGTISPEDRHLLVTSSVRHSNSNNIESHSNPLQISSIVQFRVRDHLMNTCSIKIILPKEHENTNTNNGTSLRERDWLSFSEPMNITIWTLDVSPDSRGWTWIDPRALSASTRPQRAEKLGTLLIRPGEESSTKSFVCQDGSVLSFELSCESCSLDVWQDKQRPPFGLVLEQRVSKSP